jgi:hypothetical protein
VVSSVAWGYDCFKKQINNFIRLSAIASEVRSRRTESGAFPETIPAYPDMWGREVLYLHNDSHFILVSFGSDGRPDNPDYASFLTDPPARVERHTCWVTSRDTVLVDSMPWQTCGK